MIGLKHAINAKYLYKDIQDDPNAYFLFFHFGDHPPAGITMMLWNVRHNINSRTEETLYDSGRPWLGF